MTKPLSPALFEIFGSKDNWVTTLTFLGHVAQIYFESNNLLTLGDRGSVSMEHQQEISYMESNRHVINDVTCVVTPNMFRAQYLGNGWRYRFSYDGAPIANGIWVSSGH